MNQSNLETAMEKLKSLNIKLAPQRYALLEYLYQCRQQPTVEELFKVLIKRYPYLSVTTVYSNLRVFRKLGLVREISHDNASVRYAAVISGYSMESKTG